MILEGIIPQYKIAEWLLGEIQRLLTAMGITRYQTLEEVIYLLVVVGIAVGLGWCVQHLIVLLVRKFINVRFPEVGSDLAHEHVLHRWGQVVPPVVLISMIPFAFTPGAHAGRILMSLALIYLIITFVLAVNALLGFAWVRYNTHHNARNLPLKGLLDVARGIMWILAVIVIVSVIVGKSPGALLAGIGVFASVLMLIFKDSILGLVAGVQLSLNDMMRVGDWIVVPGTDANGIVLDVSLVVVKIRNWNNTVSMIPPYTLVSKGFVNWRCMKDTGSRQIEQSVLIDINTVRPLSDDELQTIRKQLPILSDFIDIKLQQRQKGQTRNVFNKEAGVIGTIDTNLGLMRAYVNLLLQQHPYIDHDRIAMVRILQPGPNGFPLSIFAYLTTADWAAYEGITADIFENITAVAPTLFLSVYEAPSARSVYAVGENTPKPGAPYYGTDPVTTPSPDPSTNKL